MTTDQHTVVQSLKDIFHSIEDNLNGEKSSAVHRQRQEAIQAFENLGFPTLKNEEWKYTNVQPLLKSGIFSPSTEKANESVSIDNYLLDELDANIVVLLNGEYSESLSAISTQKGLTVQSFASALKENKEVVEKYFNTHEADSFTALNTAFSFNGVFIHLEKGTVAEKPIHILHLSQNKNSSVFSQPRNLIVAGENAQVSVIETNHSEGKSDTFTNEVTEIYAAKSAHVNYFVLQNDLENSSTVHTTEVTQKEKSVFYSGVFTFEGKLIRNNLNIRLDDEYCETHMYGLYLIDGSTHVDNHTLADHMKPNCESNELYKGILNGRSTGVFNGKVMVRQDAQKTNAFQSNNNILLSDDATINTKPQLEIFADDVKCSHGATSGQIDEDALYYLRARGISKDKAKSLLVRAFSNEVVDFITIEPLKKYLETIIANRLSL